MQLPTKYNHLLPFNYLKKFFTRLRNTFQTATNNKLIFLR